MPRFVHSLIRRLYLVLGVIIVGNLPGINGLIRSATQKLLQTQTGRNALGSIGQYFTNHPATIVPATVSVALIVIFLYCLYDSHFSGRPLLRVDGIPWRGPYGFTRKDGRLGFGEYAYVTIVNKSEGLTEQAIARNLMVKVQLFGSKLLLRSEARVPWVSKDGKVLAERGDLQPEDTLNVPVAIKNNSQNKMVPFKVATYSSSTPDDPYYGRTLEESLYLVKITFRGIGVYHVLWFALQNWVSNPNVMGFYPLGLFERTWVRLTLLAIGPSWEKYWERQQAAFNARREK